MLIHLEAANCPGGLVVPGEIEFLAGSCYQARKYSYMIFDRFPYFCPRCRRQFWLLSGLVQHAETSPGCRDLTTGNGCLAKLERLIAKEINRLGNW